MLNGTAKMGSNWRDEGFSTYELEICLWSTEEDEEDEEKDETNLL